MAMDSEGRNHPDVNVGADWWTRRTNRYAGCTCPPWRYSPRHPKPTNPDCQQHGADNQGT